MKGNVDYCGRAIVTISIRPSDVTAAHTMQVWIDTGFNGDLVLLQRRINDLQLRPSGTLKDWNRIRPSQLWACPTLFCFMG